MAEPHKQEIEVIVREDEWRTLHRPLPRDICKSVWLTEDLVGAEIGSPGHENRSLGTSVSIWSIIAHFLRENEAALIQCAKEWKAEGS